MTATRPYDPLADAGLWRERARGQLYVADTLMHAFEDNRQGVPLPADRREEDNAIFEAIAYHYGLALELAAKGAIVARTNAAPERLNHNLVALCQAAGIQLAS